MRHVPLRGPYMTSALSHSSQSHKCFCVILSSTRSFSLSYLHAPLPPTKNLQNAHLKHKFVVTRPHLHFRVTPCPEQVRWDNVINSSLATVQIGFCFAHVLSGISNMFPLVQQQYFCWKLVGLHPFGIQVSLWTGVCVQTVLLFALESLAMFGKECKHTSNCIRPTMYCVLPSLF